MDDEENLHTNNAIIMPALNITSLMYRTGYFVEGSEHDLKRRSFIAQRMVSGRPVTLQTTGKAAGTLEYLTAWHFHNR
jgi:hypothetical protein